jgi:hypothetical protein
MGIKGEIMADQPVEQNNVTPEDAEQQRLGMAIEACRRGAAWLEELYKGGDVNSVVTTMAGTVVEMQKTIVKAQAERGVQNGELLSRQMDVIYSNPELVTVLVSNAIFFGMGLIAPERRPAAEQKKQHKRH